MTQVHLYSLMCFTLVPPHKIFLIQKVILDFIKLETLVSETFTESWNRCLNILNN